MTSILHVVGANVHETMQRKRLAVLPVGSVEYHGPHAPLGTDSFIAQEVAAQVAERTGAILYPLIAFTACPVSTRRKPGTVAVDPDVMTNYIENVFRSLLDNGIHAIVTINAHDGNIDTIRRAADRIFFDYPDQQILGVNWWQTLPTPLVEAQGLFSDGGGHGHGGPLETSAAWAVAHDAVDLSKAPDFDAVDTRTELMRLGFEGRDESWPGYSGRISESSPEKGRKLIELSVDRIVTLINHWLAKETNP